MKTGYRIFALIISITWLYALHTQFKLAGNSLPPIGKFFNPATGFWKNVLQVDGKTHATIKSEKVSGSIYFDDRAVPHIYADQLKDAYFMQGYAHAMHRLWQMDFATRAAEGRISEIIGSKAINFDKIKRRKGLKVSALQSIEAWKNFPDELALLQSYADGFNAYLNTLNAADLPIEFKLLNYEPEPWSPYRSSLFHKSMAEILCGRDKDVELSNAKDFFGNDFALLFNEMDSLTDPVVPKGTIWEFKKNDSLPSYKSFETGYLDILREINSTGIGSNNWAVSGKKSISGNPILCNDPHLFLTLPSVWYEQQIATKDVNVYGVTFPGIPGVVIGFNKDVCWGVTNAAWDVLDWYRIKWKDESKSAYELDGAWIAPIKRIEKISVRSASDVYDTILITNWGPVVYEDINEHKHGLAMHWIIQDVTNQFEFASFSDLNKAKNLDDYRKAISQFPYPAQNFAFASASGDIALTVQGNMPLKSDQQGRFILDGSDSKNAWRGFLDNKYNPFYHNPARGFISSANQRSTDLSFPNYYNNGDFRDYRGTIINRLLAAKEKWSIEDMMQLQCNNYSLRAETSLPFMLKTLASIKVTDQQKSVLQALEKWDYVYDSNRIEPVYYEIWFQSFYKMVWDELIGDTTKRAVAIPTDQATIELMKSNSGNIWFDIKQTHAKENVTDILRMALDSVTIYTGKKQNNVNWGGYKDSQIEHMAKIPAFGKYHIHTSGAKDIINAHGKTEGPSWRMIVEMDKQKIKAYGIYPGGQSGNPGSPYYANMIKDWSQGKYYSLHFYSNESEIPKDYRMLKFTKN